MSTRLSFKHSLIKILSVFSSLCILMVIMRIFYTANFKFTFLIWNLFLAWVPLFFVLILRKNESIHKSTVRSSVLLVAWLLFFPNAPYILTDLVHLLNRQHIPLWFDLIMILSFAWTGLLTGFVSLIEIQNFFTEKFGKSISWMLTIAALVLGSFGVYLGRFGGFNSWDVIANPFELSHDILIMLIHPYKHTQMYGMTFLFSCFLILTYLTFFSLVHSKNIPVQQEIKS
ncbi:MAG: DUF1361 domain-containing protein [Bacteroidia bacterium]